MANLYPHIFHFIWESFKQWLQTTQVSSQGGGGECELLIEMLPIAMKKNEENFSENRLDTWRYLLRPDRDLLTKRCGTGQVYFRTVTQLAVNNL